MATLSTPTLVGPALVAVQGVAPPVYLDTVVQRARVTVPRDLRISNPTDGFIRDRVMLKSSSTAPEVPYTNSRVYVFRLLDAYRAWTGVTDALGYYHATGLEPGVEYLALAVDLAREHKATAAGPVLAVKG